MDFICLSEGKGFHFPPCHVLDISGFRVLFDCPMDLSALTVFSPLPLDSSVISNNEKCSCCCRKDLNLESNDEERRRQMGKPLDANSLICAEPQYKTVKNLLLLNVPFIDIVLISSPMGMMGLPFLTRDKGFSAKVYVTEAAARIGQLMMEDLVSMHKEFRQFYGPQESDGPQWMKWEELELLPSELKQIVMGADGTGFGGWMPLYSAADVKACMLKAETLKYCEEACYNGTLIIKAFSSGLDIGSCNWSISGPKGRIAYISSSVFSSATAMSFNYESLQRSDVILYSDFSSCNAPDKLEDDDNFPVGNNLAKLSVADVNLEPSAMLLDADEYLEEMEKLDFIVSCSMDAINAGGSVLIPIGRLGIVLQLLERFAPCLASEDMKVPVFLVSSVAEELMSVTNIIPEWLCKQLQDRLYSGQPLFAHMEMLKDGRLYLFPAIHSLKLLTIWQEPCIVFCPHWSMRLGPVIPLLRRWHKDPNSLLVLEEGVDSNLALLPFKPMAMKVLQCSFLSGIQLQKLDHLLKILQPRHVAFPVMLRQHVGRLRTSFSFHYYSESNILHIPNMKEDLEFNNAVELVCQPQYTTLERLDLKVSRLSGELVMDHGRHRLPSIGNEQVSSDTKRPMLHFGRVDLDGLLTALQKMGMNVTVEEEPSGAGESHKATLIHVSQPIEAMIEVAESHTLISTGDEDVASLISQAVCSILDCI